MAVAKKNSAIPGYKGYVPGQQPESDQLGETFTQMSRRSFTKQRLDLKPNLFASTGYSPSLNAF